jgi:hypothetical protein
MAANLEPFVLQYSLDRSVLATRRQFCLEDHAKGAISDNLALSVLHLALLPSNSILDLLADNFYCKSQRNGLISDVVSL